MLWSVCSGPRWQSMHLALRVKGLEPTRIVCPRLFVICGFLSRPISVDGWPGASAAVRLAPAKMSNPNSSSGPNPSYSGVVGSSGIKVTRSPARAVQQSVVHQIGHQRREQNRLVPRLADAVPGQRIGVKKSVSRRVIGDGERFIRLHRQPEEEAEVGLHLRELVGVGRRSRAGGDGEAYPSNGSQPAGVGAVRSVRCKPRGAIEMLLPLDQSSARKASLDQLRVGDAESGIAGESPCRWLEKGPSTLSVGVHQLVGQGRHAGWSSFLPILAQLRPANDISKSLRGGPTAWEARLENLIRTGCSPSSGAHDEGQA